MPEKIEIRTKLHESIYRSEGGGEVRVHWKAKWSLFNAAAAYRKLLAHRPWMTRCYGNIGHVWSHIFVDGVPVTDGLQTGPLDVDLLVYSDRHREVSVARKSKCEHTLAWLAKTPEERQREFEREEAELDRLFPTCGAK